MVNDLENNVVLFQYINFFFVLSCTTLSTLSSSSCVVVLIDSHPLYRLYIILLQFSWGHVLWFSLLFHSIYHQSVYYWNVIFLFFFVVSYSNYPCFVVYYDDLSMMFSFIHMNYLYLSVWMFCLLYFLVFFCVYHINIPIIVIKFSQLYANCKSSSRSWKNLNWDKEC